MTIPFVLLDDARKGHERLSRFSDFIGVIQAKASDEVDAALLALEDARRDGVHAVGYFAYELGYGLEPSLEPLMPQARSVPLLWFALFRKREDLTGAAATWWWENAEFGRCYAGPLRFDENADGYGRKFAAVQNHLRAGDTYQVNLSFPAHFACVGDWLGLFARLRSRALAGFGAYIDDGERSILSFSPELFFSFENGILTARPMKGTAARSPDPVQDDASRMALAASTKDRAENLMIVDLIRNDLGRVARTGTVQVEDLFAIETYPTVHQMVSTVRAECRAATTVSGIVRALFPCGSITGAPKLKTMEIIRALEDRARGIYCGAIGNISPEGGAEFNVAIRTLTITKEDGMLGLGGGIVADSQADAEYAECLLKGRFFTEARPPLKLIETLRYEPGTGFLRFDLHLARLVRSSRTFAFPLDEKATRTALEHAAQEFVTPMRVRLQLNEDGALEIDSSPFSLPSPETMWRYAISDKRVDEGDALLRHKTNWRDVHDEEYARLHRLLDCDEVVFLNRRGEIAEGSRSNVFMRKDGILQTPPLGCGVLDGCLRRELLNAGAAKECVLGLADLKTADEVYFGNSLRGLIRAMPVPIDL